MTVKHRPIMWASAATAIMLCVLVSAIAVGAADPAPEHNDYCIDGLSGGPLTVLVIERAPGGGADTERIASASNYIGDEYWAQAVRHIYDENGQYSAVIQALYVEGRRDGDPVIRAEYDTNGSEIARAESWYDDQCRLIRERHWEAGVLVSEWESVYSEDGLTEVSRRLTPAEGSLTVTRTRDELALVVSEVYEDSVHGETHYVHEYETDEFYNWIVRRTRVLGAASEEPTITRRIIQYRTYT